MPSDIDIMGVYIPPLLAAWVAGMLASALTSDVLNRSDLAARFSNPPLAFISFVAIYTVIFGSTVFPT
jgi:hypothetical protein